MAKTLIVQRKTRKVLGMMKTRVFHGKHFIVPYQTERTLTITSVKYRYGMLVSGKIYLIAHGLRDASMLPGFVSLYGKP